MRTSIRLLILSFLVLASIPTVQAYMDPIIPALLLSNQSEPNSFFTNYMIWSMILPSDSYNSYNSYTYPIGTKYVSYASPEETGWTVRSPVMNEIMENPSGEIVTKEIGFVEPDVPEGYVPFEEGYEPISAEDAMNEASSSYSSESSEGVESNPVDVSNVEDATYNDVTDTTSDSDSGGSSE